MKLLIIITKGEIGGAQLFVRGLAQALKDKGHEITVGFGAGDWLYRELAQDNIPLVRFASLKRTHNPLSNLLFFFELKKYLVQNRFDAVHINSSNALVGALAAKFSKTKPRTVFTFHGLSLLDENYLKHRALKFFYRRFFKFFLRYVDRSVFVSRANLEYARKNKIVKNGISIPNGLDQNTFNFLSPDDAREKLLSKLPQSAIRNLKSAILIGSVGRLDYAKNYEFLIGVFPEILKSRSDAVAVIIGEGPEREKYGRLIARPGLRHKFFLAGEIENAARLIRAFDLFVLPSRYEGLSMTLIEALFAGVPILASRVGGNAEALGGSAPQLYELDNEKEFLRKTNDIITNEALREELSRQNRRQAENFTLDLAAAAYEKIY